VNKQIVLLAAVLALSACNEPSPQNIMEVHVGMKSDRILEMFGTPSDVSQSYCEAGLGEPLPCTTWQYGDKWTSFTFSGKNGSLVLNNFRIHRN
jgi:hypothetical protein